MTLWGSSGWRTGSLGSIVWIELQGSLWPGFLKGALEHRAEEESSFVLDSVVVVWASTFEKEGHDASRGIGQSLWKLLEGETGSGEPSEAEISFTAGLRG